MTTKKYYYKVVTEKLRSAVTGKYHKSSDLFNIKYKLNKWVCPKFKNSKLFVFTNKKAAFNFSLGNQPVYKCEIKNPKSINKISFYWEVEKELKHFWKKLIKMNFSVDTYGFHDCTIAPSHTVSCDAVKLIEKASDI